MRWRLGYTDASDVTEVSAKPHSLTLRREQDGGSYVLLTYVWAAPLLALMGVAWAPFAVAIGLVVGRDSCSETPRNARALRARLRFVAGEEGAEALVDPQGLGVHRLRVVGVGLRDAARVVRAAYARAAYARVALARGACARLG